jgi:hypothetical protein
MARPFLILIWLGFLFLLFGFDPTNRKDPYRKMSHGEVADFRKQHPHLTGWKERNPVRARYARWIAIVLLFVGSVGYLITRLTS